MIQQKKKAPAKWYGFVFFFFWGGGEGKEYAIN